MSPIIAFTGRILGTRRAYPSEKSALPVKRLFLERVQITGKQNQQERNHRSQNQIARGVVGQHVAINHRPRIHEDHFDVEKDEQHGHQIKLHREPHAALANGVLAALVGGVLGLSAFAVFAEQDGYHERARGEANGGDKQHQHWNVLGQLRRLRRFHEDEFRKG